MNALIPAIVALITVLTLSPANAETATLDAGADVGVTATADTDATASGDAMVAAETATTENYTLENGTSVVVENGNVFTVDEKGVRTPAPDGDWATKEGKTLKVVAGALVTEDAATTEASADAETTTEAPAETATETPAE